ncbi:MAG TPA: aspartate kinase [Gaiellaceae bacterium]|nr:aspartate kinase [Gaiellaceae bacterium]
MGLVVQKFGGTSVGDPERIANVARRIASTSEAGSDVCVVVSAMGATTDDLLDLARRLSGSPNPRELDVLLTAGERISIALLAIALDALGLAAVSFTGDQAGIVTDGAHGQARIVEIRVDPVRRALAAGQIAIVAGFQGISPGRDVTTLGRGGSDATAVALAAALQADACEIYTDVDGVYTADPRIEPGATKLATVSYEEMLDLAACGARVLMLRSVELARNAGVPIHVRSSFHEGDGTWIVKEENMLERAIVSGVAHDTSEAKVTITGVPDRPGIAASLFRPLAAAGINVDMIVQNVSEAGRTDISFTLPRDDLERAEPVLREAAEAMEATGVSADRRIAKVSLVGAGMKSDPGVAADMFDALAEAGINIAIISTSPIRISCVVGEDDVEAAVRAVHAKFRLEEAGS